MNKASIFQVVLLAIFGALALTGVIIFALIQSSASKNATPPIVIWGTFDGTAFTSFLRTLADGDSSYLNISYVQKDESTYDQDLTKAFASGTGPDLFLMRQDYAVRESSEVALVPPTMITTTQFTNLFIASAQPLLTGQGALAIPVLSDPLVLYSNRSLLSTAGIAQPPQYWDQLSNMVAKLTKKDDAGSITQSAIALGEYDNVDHAKEIISMLALQAGSKITDRDNSGHLVSAMQSAALSSNTGMRSAVEFYTGFANPSNQTLYSWNRSFQSSRAAFVAGIVGFYIGFASEERTIRQLNPNLDIQVSPVPQIRALQRTAVFARVYGLAASKTGKYAASAITVAARLGAASTTSMLSQTYGIPAARRDVLGVATTTPGYSNLYNTQAITSYVWADPDPAATNSLFRDMIQSVTSGASSLSEALQRADAQMNQIISATVGTQQ